MRTRTYRSAEAASELVVAFIAHSDSLAQATLPPVGARLKVSRGSEPAVWHDYPGRSAAQAAAQAQRAGWRVLVAESTGASDTEPNVWANGAGRRRFDLLLFSQELLTLLQAGLNLTEALETLLAKAKAGAEQAILSRVAVQLREGRAFSDVLEAMPETFPQVYVATVRASEQTGTLSHALDRFITYQLQLEQLRRKLAAAAVYPLMLLAVGSFVVLFLLGFVVPRFAAVYEASGRDIPALSRGLLWLGGAIHAHPGASFALGAALVGGAAVWLRSEAVRRRLAAAVLALPALRTSAALFRLTRFYRALGLLLASGIALPRAMGMVGGVLGSAERAALERARLQLEQGLPVSQTFVANGLASPVAESLIRVGERSGQLAAMLERTASFHDEELSRRVDSASRLIEPVLMLLIGLVIGTVVVLMYLPIFDLAGSF